MIRNIQIYLLIIFLSAVSDFTYAQYEATRREHNYLLFNHLKENLGVENMVADNIFEDESGFMWLSTETGLCRFDGSRFQYFTHKFSATENRPVRVSAFFQDSGGDLWIGSGHEIFRFNSCREEFEKIEYTVGKDKRISVITSIVVHDNTICIGTHEGVYRASFTDSSHLEFVSMTSALGKGPMDISCLLLSREHLLVGTRRSGLFLLNNFGDSIPALTAICREELMGHDIMQIAPYSHDRILVTTSRGLVMIDGKQKCRTILHNEHITSASVTSTGEIWCSTFGDGIFYFRDLTGSPENYRYFGTDNRTFNFINKSFVDSKDNLWIVPEKLGVRWLSNTSRYIVNYTQLHTHSGLWNNIVKDIAVDHQGNWYVGTYCGLSIFHSEGKEHEHVSIPSGSKAGNQIETIFLDGNILWIGTRDGLYRYHTATGMIEKLPVLNHTLIWTIAPAHNGKGLWLGTERGLYRIEPDNNNRLVHYPLRCKESLLQGEMAVLTVLEDSQHRLWVGTDGEGLLRADVTESPDSLDFVSCTHSGKNNVLDSYTIHSLYESEDHTVWIGTQNGLYSYLGKCRFQKFAGKEGKPYNIVKAICEDRNHRLWLTTHLGITVLAPSSREVVSFNSMDGMSSDIFNMGACVMTRDNTLLAGSLKGLVALNVDSLAGNTEAFPLCYVSSVSVNNVELAANTEFNGRIVSDVAPRFMNRIELKSDENNISVVFGGIEFSHHNRLRWAYRIQELDEAWHYLPEKQNMITLFNMPQGHYRIEYKSTNIRGQWNEKSETLYISILPHWSRTPLAYVIYGCLLTILLYCFMQHQKQKIKEKQSIEHERELHRQTLELEQDKIEFFTNVSHELRTPLTLITAPLQVLKEKGSHLSADVRNYYVDMMYGNVRLLNRQIEQLLNFSKIHNGKASLHLGYHDVVHLVRHIVDNFTQYAGQKQITLNLTCNELPDRLVCDRGAIETIVCNLLSNAVKYSPGGSEVNIVILLPSDMPGFFCISVCDEGIGISEEQQQYIFNRFIRLDNAESKSSGIGIGLAYTKALVDLHQGKITVDSRLDEGSCFSVYLPTTLTENVCLDDNDGNVTSEYMPLPESQPGIGVCTDKSHEDTLLIVEDNPDLQAFLMHFFESRYKVLLSDNGADGLQLAIQHLPDIIITDVMMPKMDGMEMTRKIKSNLLTSYIPIIMLTAKGEMQDELEGLESGANYYIKKPFYTTQLELIVQNIQLQQKNMREHLVNDATPPVADKDVNLIPSADAFYGKVEKYIIEHLSSTELTVESISAAMNMSSVHLYRKLKAAADIAPNDLIRDIRMKRAVRMLLREDMNISEVAYAVGYSDPKYFSKCFKTTYGISPSAYVKEKRGAKNKVQ